jgi:hypothetical protein
MQLLNRSDNLAPQLAGFAVAANQQFLDAAFSVVGRWDPVLVDEKLGGAADVWREMSKPYRQGLDRHNPAASRQDGGRNPRNQPPCCRAIPGEQILALEQCRSGNCREIHGNRTVRRIERSRERTHPVPKGPSLSP